jgi:hypothetical protein
VTGATVLFDHVSCGVCMVPMTTATRPDGLEAWVPACEHTPETRDYIVCDSENVPLPGYNRGATDPTTAAP